VLETKVAGLRHLLSALDAKALKFLVLVLIDDRALRETGQSDYAVANEALNKSAQWLSRRLPDCRSVSLIGTLDGGMVNGRSSGYSSRKACR